MTWDYLAGLFDGEGSVGLYAVTNGRANSKTYYSPKLVIVGTYRPMIEAVHAFVGLGSFSTQKRQALSVLPNSKTKYSVSGRSKTRLCKQGWKWAVTSQSDIVHVLKKIIPLLHEKRTQAEAVLAFCLGKLEGTKASAACKKAKKFNFPANDWIEPVRRIPAFKGENNPFAKLSNDQVRDLRRRVLKGESTPSLMKRFGIKDRGTVWRIKTKRAYAEVD